MDRRRDAADLGVELAVVERDAAKANQTITISVTRDDSEPADDIEMQLDANGCGSEEFEEIIAQMLRLIVASREYQFA